MNPIEILSKPLNLDKKLFQPIGQGPQIPAAAPITLPKATPITIASTPLPAKVSSLIKSTVPVEQVKLPTSKVQTTPFKSLSAPLPSSVLDLARTTAAAVPDHTVRRQDFKDVGNLPSELIINPILNGIMSLNEVRTGKPSGKVNVPFPHMVSKTDGDYTRQVPLEDPAVGTRRYYEDLVKNGVPDDQAYHAAIVKTIGDMSVLVPLFRDASKLALLKTAPEKLINAEVLNETNTSITRNQMRDYLSGRTPNFDMPQELRESISHVLNTGTNAEKKSLLNGVVGTQTLSVEPSRLGKILGISQDEANTLLDQLYGGKTRQAPVGALPGYREVPGQPHPVGLSTRKVESVGGAYPEIPEPLKPVEKTIKKSQPPERTLETINSEIDSLYEKYAGDPNNATIKTELKKLEEEARNWKPPVVAKDTEVPTKKVRVNTKLEKQALEAPTFNEFYNRSGITREALDTTAQSKGFANAEDFYKKTKAVEKVLKPEQMTSLETIADRMGKRDKTLEEIDHLRLNIDDLEQIIDDSQARKLVKYVSRATGNLPDVIGKHAIKSLSGSGKTVKNSEFGIRGDDIVTEMGFESPEAAQEALDAYRSVKAQLQTYKQRLVKAKAEKKLIRVGETLMKLTMSERRAQFRILKDRYDLTDRDVKNIRQDRDLSMMPPEEFQNFIKQAERRAVELEKIREARIQVEGTIQQKELKKVDNLRKALELPEIKDMNEAQLKEFDRLLSSFEQGDEFLGQKKLETIDRTALKGVKTYREAREKLAETLSQRFGRKVSAEELSNIVGSTDRLKWDTSLAESNPFYRLMVEDVNTTLLEGESNVLAIQEEVEKLMGRVNKGAKNKLVPRNHAIVEYLESSDKASIAPRLTPDEYKAAEYIRSYYNQALKYLYEQKALHKSRFEDLYYTHMRRSFLEAIIDTPFSEGKLKTAMKELLEKTKLEKTIIDILDQKTGQILPMDKYFKYVSAREGNMLPSKNVAKVFMEYVKTFETKRALDKMVPEIMTYVDVLTPRKETRAGLKVDDKLKTFVSEYINNKKGRRATLLFSQGSKPDYVLKALATFISLRDLGINFAVQIGSNAGAQGGVFTLLGPTNYAKGLWRYKATVIPKRYQTEAVAKAQAILDQSKAYTGRNPWSELVDISKDFGDKLHSSMFVLFRDAVVRSNQIHLLGALSKEEWQAGKISNARLAQLRIEAGRWLPVEKAESIYGSTTVGKAGTKYKTWAIVMASTSMKNIKEVLMMAKKFEGKKLYESKEGRELVNAAIFTAFVAYMSWSVIKAEKNSKNKKQGFLGKVRSKLIQDGMSFIQALSPNTLFSTPRLVSFLQDLGVGLVELVQLEKYQSSGTNYKKGQFKGVNKLENTLEPNIMKTLIDAFVSESKGADLKSSSKLSGIKLQPKTGTKIDLKSSKINLSGIKLVPKEKVKLK
jgi:hypothetical protein